MIKTLGQQRAEFALNSVLAIHPDIMKRFKPFSAGAPSMILQNGFGQALAFWISKSATKEEYLAMFHIVREWLNQNNLASGQDKADFMQNLTAMDWKQYLRAQKEALALLEWVKRFANADL